jgi:hypothetical protein
VECMLDQALALPLKYLCIIAPCWKLEELPCCLYWIGHQLYDGKSVQKL